MPHGITQCYLPPGRGDIPAFNPAEAGTRLSDPGGCKAELTQLACCIPGWHTRPKTVTHPGTNRARRALTSFMRRTPLTTTPRLVCGSLWLTIFLPLQFLPDINLLLPFFPSGPFSVAHFPVAVFAVNLHSCFYTHTSDNISVI